MKRAKEKHKTNKNQKGITLIALVITIVVLLILAGITITTLFGEGGIITRAKYAEEAQDHAAVKDAINVLYLDYFTKITTNSSNVKIASTTPVKVAVSTAPTTFIDYLVQEGYANSAGVINIQNLVGSNTKYGKGPSTGTSDVYIVSQTETGYELNYYDKAGNPSKAPIWKVASAGDTSVSKYYDGLDVTPTDPKYFEFVLDETTKTATLKGVLDKYAEKHFYNGEYYTSAIVDGGVYITDVVIPYKVVENQIEYKVTSIADKAFLSGRLGEWPSRFTSFAIPNTVKNIGMKAFFQCSSLESIFIPRSVSTIGRSAFQACFSLTNIFIPLDVTSIGENAFESCGSLSNVYYEGSEEDWNKITIDNLGNGYLINATIHYEATGLSE